MQTLRYGDEGLFVRYIQAILRRANEDAGEIDGIFGRKTLRAVTAFQSKNGLTGDGIVGNLTWAALYPYLCGYRICILREGEHPETLAERFGTELDLLLTANPNTSWSPGAVIVVPMPFDVVYTDLPYSAFLTAAVVEGLQMRYPQLNRFTIGSSVKGRAIEAVRVGEGERKVGVNAAHHANEWITDPLTLVFLERFLKAIASDSAIGGVSARSLYSESSLMLVPLVNPDGVDLVTGAIDENDSYYLSAKALSGYYPSIPFPDGWKANILGVDLNLGYPAGWERARSIKFAQGYTRPGPRDYVGTRPLEAPENRAMAQMTEREQFDRTLSFHTQGEEIYWEYQGEAPQGAKALAERFAEVSGYRLGEVPYNSSFAGYKDWFISVFDRSGFTIEAGKGENPLPISDLESIYQRTEGIFVAALLPNGTT